MKDREIRAIFIILIILFVILLIIGIVKIIESITARDELITLSLIMLLDNPFGSFALSIYLKYGGQGPNFSNFISGVVMIIIGIVGPIISIIIYNKFELIKTFFKNWENKFESKYNRKVKKDFPSKFCPACKAPLKKIPPCECEYCGSFLK
ncbi:MAG: hypothetical protein ACFFDN_01125 [Candidatus Hodarchaeota archaeon]